MKAGKKIARGAEKRGANRPDDKGKSSNNNPGFRAPGSRNKKKTGGC